MERWKGQVVLVTGASTGIGEKIAQTLVKQGLKVVGCARNIEKIQQLAMDLKEESGELHPIRCDVSKEEEVVAMFTWIKDKFGAINILINNAGLNHAAPILSGSASHWQEMLNVNVLGVSLCTREMVKLLKACDSNDGHIININAGFGHFVAKMADWNFYSATKYAVTALTEGTRSELKQSGSKCRVTDISPWMTESELVPRAMGMSPEEGKAFYEKHSRLYAQDIADAVVYVLAAPPHVQIRDLNISHSDIA